MGKRPSLDSVRGLVESAPQVSISHVPPSADVSPDRQLVLELLCDGLTFDCTGLAPGTAIVSPTIEHRFDVPDEVDLAAFETVFLSAGSHLKGGARSLPVIRGLLNLARTMVHHFSDAEIACWSPSKSAIGRRFFESTVTAWLDGGPFPALGLTVFNEQSDGSLVSCGLSHFIDQEIRIEPALASDKLSATRLGIRLINQLVLVGGIDQSERIIGPDGSRLLLRPSRDGRFVRVFPE